jgi:Fe2+ or Zn2+ uptake regulation protein
MSANQAKVISIKGERMEAEDYLFILKEFHRLLRKTLKPAVYAVFCAIEDRAGAGEQDGTPAYTCYASHTTLAEDISVKRLTVFRSIKVLEEVGLITVEEREGETSFIHPIATPEKRATYLLNHEKTTDTCIKKIQVIYPLFQNDTGVVSKRYTNGTTLKEQPKEFKTTKDKSLGEQGSQTNNDNILDFPSTDSPPDKASQPAHGYEQNPVEPKKVSGRTKAHNQGVEKEKAK